MESNLHNRLTDAEEAERKRRSELGMLDLLIDSYLEEAWQKVSEKLRKSALNRHQTVNKNIGFEVKM